MEYHAGDKIGYQLMEWDGSAWIVARGQADPMNIHEAVSYLDEKRERHPGVRFCIAKLTIAVIDVEDAA